METKLSDDQSKGSLEQTDDPFTQLEAVLLRLVRLIFDSCTKSALREPPVLLSKF